MSVAEIVRPAPSPDAGESASRIRGRLGRRSRAAAGPRRVPEAGAARVVANIDRVRLAAWRRRTPFVDHEDLVQEGLLAQLEEMARPGAPPPPGGVAMERVADRHIRRAIAAARRQLPGWLDANLGAGPDGLGQLDRAAEGRNLTYDRGMVHMRPALDRLMRALPRRSRTILMLRYGLDGREPLPRAAIARALGVAPSAIWYAERRAIAMLRESSAARRP